MQELTFVAPGSIEWRERAAPRIEGAGQALVRPLAVSRCDLDFVLARGKAPVQGPFALGHEAVAEVLEISDDVRGVRPGDRVVVPFQISCGIFGPFRRGRTSSCASVPKLAAYGLGPLGGGGAYGGALSDVLRVPYADAMLVKLDRAIDPVIAAALGDNAIDGWRTVAEPLAREPGAKVLIASGGAPSIGLYAVAAARALGAGEVVYVDASVERCAIAGKLGARVVRSKTEPSLRIGRFPITVDATGREEGLRFCLSSTDAWGECTSIGIYFTDVALPLFSMYSCGVRFVTGRVDARRDLPAALAAVASGAFDVAPIATNVVPWSDAPSAWLEPATKVVLTTVNAVQPRDAAVADSSVSRIQRGRENLWSRWWRRDTLGTATPEQRSLRAWTSAGCRSPSSWLAWASRSKPCSSPSTASRRTGSYVVWTTPSDRRSKRVEYTPAGLRAVRDANAIKRRMDRELRASLGARSLDELRTALGEVTRTLRDGASSG